MPVVSTSPIHFENDELSESFEIRPFRVGHDLENHPLFQIGALLDAADQLPASFIEYNAGDVPISLVEGKSTGNGQTPRQIFERMSAEKVWLGLKKIDLLPEYREAIINLLSSVDGGISATHPGMFNLEGYVFISSPATIVPYHMDTEHNFLLQIRGDKTMHMLDRNDPAVICDEDLERYYTNSTRRMSFDPALHEHAAKWYLEPGIGMHVPVTYPHYVENGESLSVSLSTTFDTPRQQARARVYKVNYHLRKLGLKPVSYGASPVRDGLKSAAGRLQQSIFNGRKSSW